MLRTLFSLLISFYGGLCKKCVPSKALVPKVCTALIEEEFSFRCVKSLKDTRCSHRHCTREILSMEAYDCPTTVWEDVCELHTECKGLSSSSTIEVPCKRVELDRECKDLPRPVDQLCSEEIESGEFKTCSEKEKECEGLANETLNIIREGRLELEKVGFRTKLSSLEIAWGDGGIASSDMIVDSIFSALASEPWFLDTYIESRNDVLRIYRNKLTSLLGGSFNTTMHPELTINESPRNIPAGILRKIRDFEEEEIMQETNQSIVGLPVEPSNIYPYRRVEMYIRILSKCMCHSKKRVIIPMACPAIKLDHVCVTRPVWKSSMCLKTVIDRGCEKVSVPACKKQKKVEMKKCYRRVMKEIHEECDKSCNTVSTRFLDICYSEVPLKRWVEYPCWRETEGVLVCF